jgi:hypothetical protein
MFYTKMKKVNKRFNIKHILPFCIVLFAFVAKGQSDKYEEFIIKDKIYKPGCTWLKFGVGMDFDWYQQEAESNANLAVSFRIKNMYWQTGYHVSSDKFFTERSYQKLNDLYLAPGLRRETNKSNASIFIGPSYAYGSTFDHYSTYNGVTDKKWYRRFNQIGLFGSVEYTLKIYYDLGLGLSVYGSINKYYSVTGFQVHIYFSGAFKGAIK